MYLWVVLATFIVAIVSFSLSVRPDADRAFVETKAQTEILKFKMRHNAFVSFIFSKRIKLKGTGTWAEDEQVKYCSGMSFDGENISGLECLDEFSEKPNYTVENIKAYLPYGFDVAPLGGASTVYCKDAKDETNQSTCEENGFSPCCTDKDVYVFSWQEIPGNWIIHRDEKDTTSFDMLRAITKSSGYGSSFGFNEVSENDEGNSKQFISGGVLESDSEGNLSRQKQEIWPFLQSEAYKAACGKSEKCFVALQKIPTREDGNEIVKENDVNNQENNEENQDENE